MNPITLVLFFVASAAAGGSSASFRMESSPQLLATAAQKDTIPIVRFAQDIRAGHDAVSFESGNGIVLEDNTKLVTGRGGSYEDGQGKLIQTDQSIVKTGTYTYTSPEGLPITVRWTADEHGFRAEGDHLPVAPTQQAQPAKHAAVDTYDPAHVIVSRHQ